MPRSNEKGKAETFYAVAELISNRHWLKFARGESYLNLPESEIDDIQHDFSADSKERKYRMLLAWEQRLGPAATPQKLEMLANNFSRQGCDASFSAVDSVDSVGNPRRQQVAPNFRMEMMKISRELTNENFEELQLLYSHVAPGPFESPMKLLFYLENNDLISNTANPTVDDKVASLCETLLTINRGDLCQRLKDGQQTSLNQDRTDAVPIPTGPTPMEVDISGPSQQPVTKGSPERSVTNQMTGVTIIGGTIHQQAGDVIHQGMVNQGINDSSAKLLKQYASNVPDSELNIIQGLRQQAESQYMQKHKGAKESGSSKQYTKSGRPKRRVVNQMSGVTIIGGTVHQQAGDVIHHSMTNQAIHNSSAKSTNQYPGNIPGLNFDLDSIQKLCQLAKDNKPGSSNLGFVQKLNQQTHHQKVENPKLNAENMCEYNDKNPVVPSSKAFYDEMMKKTSTVYKVKSKPKGNVLILSNVEFWNTKWNRKDGEKECSLMSDLFGETKLGFKVFVEENKTDQEMERILAKFANLSDHKKADICIVFIMSHGGRDEKGDDVIYGVNQGKVKAKDVVRRFDNDNCIALRNKPKLFFFQFCRGDVADAGVPLDHADNIPSLSSSVGRLSSSSEFFDNFDMDSTDATTDNSLPSRSDVLIAYATQEGNLAFRSWFTNAIANVFSRNAHKDDLVEMLNEVKRQIAAKSSKTGDSKTHNCKEMADVRDMLLKKVYLFPGLP